MRETLVCLRSHLPCRLCAAFPHPSPADARPFDLYVVEVATDPAAQRPRERAFICPFSQAVTLYRASVRVRGGVAIQSYISCGPIGLSFFLCRLPVDEI